MKLITPKIAEVPKSVLTEFDASPAVGRFDSLLDEDFVDAIVKSLKHQILLGTLKQPY